MLIKSFKEECINLLTNKINIVVLFVLPILTVIMLGVELNKEVIDNIPMAVIDYDQSAFSDQLIDSFDQNETFSVISYPGSEEELETMLKNSQVRTGMIIPKNFYSDIVDLKSPTVLMFYDGSHMSMTSVAKSKAMEILLTFKAGATIKQLMTRLNISYEEAYNITQAFQFSNRMLYNPAKSFRDFLAPILMAGVIQAALVLIVTVTVDHEMYLRPKQERIGYATGKVLFYTLCGSLVFMICVTMQVQIFKMPFLGSMKDALILSAGLSFSVSAFCVMLSALFKNRMIALIAGGVLFIPNSVMAGTTWPLISMPIGYRGFAKYTPFAHFVNNIRNIYLKGSSMEQMGQDVIFLFVFGAIVLVVTELVMLIVDEETKDKELINHGLPRNN